MTSSYSFMVISQNKPNGFWLYCTLRGGAEINTLPIDEIIAGEIFFSFTFLK